MVKFLIFFVLFLHLISAQKKVDFNLTLIFADDGLEVPSKNHSYWTTYNNSLSACMKQFSRTDSVYAYGYTAYFKDFFMFYPRDVFFVCSKRKVTKKQNLNEARVLLLLKLQNPHDELPSKDKSTPYCNHYSGSKIKQLDGVKGCIYREDVFHSIPNYYYSGVRLYNPLPLEELYENYYNQIVKDLAQDLKQDYTEYRYISFLSYDSDAHGDVRMVMVSTKYVTELNQPWKGDNFFHMSTTCVCYLNPEHCQQLGGKTRFIGGRKKIRCTPFSDFKYSNYVGSDGNFVQFSLPYSPNHHQHFRNSFDN